MATRARVNYGFELEAIPHWKRCAPQSADATEEQGGRHYWGKRNADHLAII